MDKPGKFQKILNEYLRIEIVKELPEGLVVFISNKRQYLLDTETGSVAEIDNGELVFKG